MEGRALLHEDFKPFKIHLVLPSGDQFDIETMFVLHADHQTSIPNKAYWHSTLLKQLSWQVEIKDLFRF